MVIGNGLIAKSFSSYLNNDSFLIFASGVSNSKNTNALEYSREKSLLTKMILENRNKKLVYFSTCSIYDPVEADSPYVQHKKEIESIIKENARLFNIFRVSNVVGHSANPNTLLNFFYIHITHRINFDMWVNAYRNLIDIDDMYCIIHLILNRGLNDNQVINIANTENYSVQEIVNVLERKTGISANYIKIEKGTNFKIDTSLIEPIIAETEINFSRPAYLNNLITKYYSANDFQAGNIKKKY